MNRFLTQRVVHIRDSCYHCFSRPLLLVISLIVRFFFLSLCVFVKIACAFRCVCVICFIGIDHHFFKSLLHSIGTGSTTLTTRKMQGYAVSLKNVFVEIPSSRPHFHPLFCVGRASTNCSPALPRIKCLGFHGSPTQMIRNSLSQESLPDSCLHTCLISAQRGVNRMSSSDVSFLPANTSLLHRSSRFVLSALWFLNKQIAPNCTSSLPRVFAYAVRPSLLIWNRVSMHEAVSLLSC